jgi:hypothetical protein
MDFSGVLDGLVATTIIAAVIAAGAIKAGPNFARWGVNKLAGFFR